MSPSRFILRIRNFFLIFAARGLPIMRDIKLDRDTNVEPVLNNATHH